MKRIVSGLLLLALLSGCTSAAMQKTPEDSGRDAPLTVVQESMPEDFAVRFTWWYDTDRKSIMDTQEGLLQRDRIQRFCRSCMRLFARMDSWIFGGQ